MIANQVCFIHRFHSAVWIWCIQFTFLTFRSSGSPVLVLFFTCMLFLQQSLLPTLSNSSWGLRRWLWDLPSLGQHETSQGLVYHTSTFDGAQKYCVLISLPVLWCYLYSLLSSKRKRLSAPVPVMGSQPSSRHGSTHGQPQDPAPSSLLAYPTEHRLPPEPSRECQGGIQSSGECILCTAKR